MFSSCVPGKTAGARVRESTDEHLRRHGRCRVGTAGTFVSQLTHAEDVTSVSVWPDE